MIDRVERIAKNPIAHRHEEDPTDFLKLEAEAETANKSCLSRLCGKKGGD